MSNEVSFPYGIMAMTLVAAAYLAALGIKANAASKDVADPLQQIDTGYLTNEYY